MNDETAHSLGDGSPRASHINQPNQDIESEERERKRKRRNKVRSAWISFVGRIVAQFVGAAASIVLGLMVLQKYQASTVKTSDPPSTSKAHSAQATIAPARAQHSSGQLVVAVLPFENFSTDPSDHLADGMTETLTAALSLAPGVRVVSRTSAMHYKSVRMALPEIARELGADLIVEGSVTGTGGRVRVIAQLIDARTDEHAWAATYDRRFRDLLSFQSDVAGAIVRDLMVAIERRPHDGSLVRTAASPRKYADPSGSVAAGEHEASSGLPVRQP